MPEGGAYSVNYEKNEIIRNIYYTDIASYRLRCKWGNHSAGSAAAFMITGPSTKITNLGALKIVMGMKRFILYILFVVAFAFVTGIVTDLLI